MDRIGSCPPPAAISPGSGMLPSWYAIFFAINIFFTITGHPISCVFLQKEISEAKPNLPQVVLHKVQGENIRSTSGTIQKESVITQEVAEGPARDRYLPQVRPDYSRALPPIALTRRVLKDNYLTKLALEHLSGITVSNILKYSSLCYGVF